MNAETEISTEENLEPAGEPKPVAIYSVNFTNKISFANKIGSFTEKRIVPRRKLAVIEIPSEKSFSRKIFNWRNAVPLAAILAIGVLHFAFQVSVIRPEVSENHALQDVPPIKVEPARAVPVEAVPAAVAPAPETKKTSAAPLAPQRNAVRVKPRQVENAPSVAPAKPVIRKKEPVESRAERLRRAERILTGI